MSNQTFDFSEALRRIKEGEKKKKSKENLLGNMLWNMDGK